MEVLECLKVSSECKGADQRDEEKTYEHLIKLEHQSFDLASGAQPEWFPKPETGEVENKEETEEGKW